MKIEIRNDCVVFIAETMGAEPWILRFADEEINYIWRPHDNPEKSGGTPLCFPLLGAVPEGKYTLEGKVYEMGMHGFAQYYDFAVIEKRENAVRLEIRDTPETLCSFPWRFRFQVLYYVEDRTLKTTYRVINEDKRPMFFSVGGHPRFSCPIEKDGANVQFSDYILEFDQSHPPEHVVKSYGPLDAIGHRTSADGRTLRLDYALFEKGAFCYGRADNRTVSLKRGENGRALVMKSEGCAFLSLWTARGNPFIALEPWYGSITSLAVNPKVDGDWMAREGTLQLNPGEIYTAVYYITMQRSGT